MKLNRRQHMRQLACCAMGNAVLLPSHCLTLSAKEPYLFFRGNEVEFATMGSLLNLRWFDNRFESRRRVLALAKVLAQKWTDILSDYEPESEVSKCCEQADLGKWVHVSTELWETILSCDFWYRQSDGAFDAALGALTRLRRKRNSPTPDQWNEAKARCGWRFVELDTNKRAFRTHRTGVRLDFGAIGKGIVVDKIAAALRDEGISQFIVNAAGNMHLGDAPNATLGWPVTIENPTINIGEDSCEFTRLRLSRCGLATSGDRWQRFLDAPPSDSNTNQRKTSHILDPATLMGVRSHSAVTVIAEHATDADAIATITSVRIRSNLSGWLATIAAIRPSARVWVLDRISDNAPLIVRYAGSDAR